MRILAFAILGIGTVSIGPAAAQTHDPAYPVCLHVWDQGANYYDCRYTSLPQCNAAASRRAAGCVVNPFLRARECRPDHIIAVSTKIVSLPSAIRRSPPIVWARRQIAVGHPQNSIRRRVDHCHMA